MTRERDLEDRLCVFRRGARLVLDEMIADIDPYRDQFGVESICTTLAQSEGSLTPPPTGTVDGSGQRQTDTGASQVQGHTARPTEVASILYVKLFV